MSLSGILMMQKIKTQIKNYSNKKKNEKNLTISFGFYLKC